MAVEASFGQQFLFVAVVAYFGQYLFVDFIGNINQLYILLHNRVIFNYFSKLLLQNNYPLNLWMFYKILPRYTAVINQKLIFRTLLVSSFFKLSLIPSVNNFNLWLICIIYCGFLWTKLKWLSVHFPLYSCFFCSLYMSVPRVVNLLTNDLLRNLMLNLNIKYILLFCIFSSLNFSSSSTDGFPKTARTSIFSVANIYLLCQGLTHKSNPSSSTYCRVIFNHCLFVNFCIG